MNTELVAIIAVLLTNVFGFLGMIIMMLQLNNQVKAEVRLQFKDLSSRMDKMDSRIDKLDSRIDRLDAKIDKINSDLSARIDRLTDAIYNQKAS